MLGAAFWDALSRYLMSVEEELSGHILKQLGWPHPQVSKLSLHRSPRDRTLNPGNRRRAWASYPGNMDDFYDASLHILTCIDRSSAGKILRRSNQSLLGGVKTAYENMGQIRLPKKLKINPRLQFQKLGSSSYALISSEGAFEVSQAVFDTIKLFNGKLSNSKILEEARAKWGLRLRRNIIEDFYKYGLVVGA
jgi:hypothetical protein